MQLFKRILQMNLGLQPHNGLVSTSAELKCCPGVISNKTWIIRKQSGGVFLSRLLKPFGDLRTFGEVGFKIKILLLLRPVLLSVCSRCWGSGCTSGGAPTFQGAVPSPTWWPASGWTLLQPTRATSSVSYRLRECKFTLRSPWWQTTHACWCRCWQMWNYFW